MSNKLDSYIDKIKNKNILIQGLGLNGGGLGTALFFLENGFDITITDLKNEKSLSKTLDLLKNYKNKIKYTLGCHQEKDFIDADLVVKGPGVPPSNLFIKVAIENGAIITSDIEIFFNIIDCPVYAVTGSKGKSTSVSAIYNIFSKKSSNSFIGGNITISPLTFYKKLDKKSLVILELSSWQLRDLAGKGIRFNGCAITNLLQDHQNYYSAMEQYLDDKKIIVENLTNNDFCLLPADDRYLNKKNIKTDGKVYFFSNNKNSSNFYYEDGFACFFDGSKTEKLFNVTDIKIPGEHMLTNLLIAGAFNYLAGIEKKYIEEGIKTFNGAPYRMELVRIWNGIKFVNDTTATIPDASKNALLAFKEPIVWIAGGNDKNLDFSIMQDIVGIPKKIFLLKGDGTEKMKKYIARNDFVESDSLEYLFNEAIKSANEGDVVLLSPGCTSFGLFQNEFHRGDVFNVLVNSL